MTFVHIYRSDSIGVCWSIMYSPSTSHLYVVGGISTSWHVRDGSERDEGMSPKSDIFLPLSADSLSLKLGQDGLLRGGEQRLIVDTALDVTLRREYPAPYLY